MKQVQEYKILPQNERDNNMSNNMKPLRSTSNRKCSCCFTTTIILAIIAIIVGVTGLAVSLLYPHQFSNVMAGAWSSQPELVKNNLLNNNMTEQIIDEPVSVGNVTFVTNSGKDENKTTEETKSTIEPPPEVIVPDIVDDDSRTATIGTTNVSTSDVDTALVDKNDEYSDEEFSEEVDETTTAPLKESTTEKAEIVEEKPTPTEEKGKKKKGDKEKHKKKDRKTEDDTDTNPELEKTVVSKEEDNDSDKFLEQLEKKVEDMTGIRRAEVVVPLFMFVCFLLSLLIASCCCYLLMRRKDNRRRRVLGKIITDLHTGDSKSILLDQEMDD